MPRIELDLPDRFPFKTEIDVRMTDLDYSGRLNNQALLMLMGEARVKFMRSMGYQDGDVEGVGTVMVDAAMIHEAGCAAGDILAFEMTAEGFSPTGCDLFYRVTNAGTGALVARAKTAMDFIDPDTASPVAVPGRFRTRFV